MKNVAIVVGVLVLVVAGYFGYKALYPSGAMKSAPPANLTVPANTVIVKGSAFNPETLNVKVGTTVTWTNNDGIGHTITSDDGTFDSGPLADGKSFTFTFTKAGTFSYHCSIHTFMTGKVVVN